MVAILSAQEGFRNECFRLQEVVRDAVHIFLYPEPRRKDRVLLGPLQALCF